MNMNKEPSCSEKYSLSRGTVIGLVVLAILFTAGSADAASSELWSKTFGGAGGEIAYSVAQTADGGYILAGDAFPPGADDRDAWLIKLGEEQTGTAGRIEASPAEKAAGFEVFLVIIVLLAVAGRKRR